MTHHTLANLQKQLREKFPMARHGVPTAVTPPNLVPDFCNPDTFPRGGISEIIPTNPGAATHLLLASLLLHEPANPSVPTLALIDARDTFDPASFPAADCSKLLWIRCSSSQQALKAADLILRDGNIPRVVIDLLSSPSLELRSIPDSSWHRLNRSIQTNDLCVIAFVPYPRIPCTRSRWFLHSRFTLDHFTQSREELLGSLHARTDCQWKQAL